VNEADVTTEVTNLLKRLWLWPRKSKDLSVCSACGNRNYPKGGHPDIEVLNAPVVVEVKVFDYKKGRPWASAVFPFASITKEQHVWLDMYTYDAMLQDNEKQRAFLALGTVHGRAGAGTNPRMLWLVPWTAWCSLERDVMVYRKSLPLSSYKGQKPRRVSELGLNAMLQLKGCELWWSHGKWHLPWGHALQASLPRAYREHGERSLEGFRLDWQQMGEKYDRDREEAEGRTEG
jgi:hypothetical protein